MKTYTKISIYCKLDKERTHKTSGILDGGWKLHSEIGELEGFEEGNGFFLSFQACTFTPLFNDLILQHFTDFRSLNAGSEHKSHINIRRPGSSAMVNLNISDVAVNEINFKAPGNIIMSYCKLCTVKPAHGIQDNREKFSSAIFDSASGGISFESMSVESPRIALNANSFRLSDCILKSNYISFNGLSILDPRVKIWLESIGCKITSQEGNSALVTMDTLGKDITFSSAELQVGIPGAPVIFAFNNSQNSKNVKETLNNQIKAENRRPEL